MRRSLTFIFPVLGLSLFVIVPNATAEMTFHPSISLREAYDDNIYLTAYNKKDDFITTITPNFNLDYKGNRLDLSLNYGADLLFYAKNSGEDRVDQTGALSSKLTIIREALFLKLDDTYQRIQIDQRKQTTLNSTLVNMTDSNTLTVNPYLALPLSSKITYNLGYTYKNIWYGSSEGINAQEHTLATGLSYQLLEGMLASVNYSYLFYRPTKLSDEYDMQNVSLGLTYQVTSKLSLNGNVGESFIRYRILDSRDESSPIWNVQGDYHLTEKLSFNCGYAVSFGNSVDQGAYKSYSGTAGIKYAVSLPLTIAFFHNESDYLQIIRQRKDLSNGVRADISLPITSRISLKIGGTYTHYKFLPEGERSDRYGAQTSIEYVMNKNTLSLGYTYNMNDSNFATNDYKDNIVFIEAKLAF
jgi:opacity protein-like surface antigen